MASAVKGNQQAKMYKKLGPMQYRTSKKGKK